MLVVNPIGNYKNTFWVLQKALQQFGCLTGNYVLCVRSFQEGKGDIVRHYKIKPLDDDKGFFITPRRTLPNLQELVKHYSGIYIYIYS